MTDIIEKAAEALLLEVSDQGGVYYMTIPRTDAAIRAVIRSLRDNTDSPRVCDELTRMLGEVGSV